MPRLTDRAVIRRVLETDRAWALYALGDLAPGFFEHSEWFCADGAPALALLYRAFETPVLFTLGEASLVRTILDEIGDEREMYLSIRPEILPFVKERYAVQEETLMWRMILNSANFRGVSEESLAAAQVEEKVPSLPSEIMQTPIEQLDLSVRAFNSLKRTGITTVGEVLELLDKREEAVFAIRDFGEKSLDELRDKPAPAGNVVRLGASDLADLRRLYEDGQPAGEAPDFFSPSMLDQGVFFGIREEGVLIAVAGTHLVSLEESVGAVGNVYTRRDWRGRGLAAQATSAVTSELLRQGLRTIGLNVNQQNLAAIRVYERLGYRKYCEFYEGMAIGR